MANIRKHDPFTEEQEKLARQNFQRLLANLGVTTVKKFKDIMDAAGFDTPTKQYLSELTGTDSFLLFSKEYSVKKLVDAINGYWKKVKNVELGYQLVDFYSRELDFQPAEKPFEPMFYGNFCFLYSVAGSVYAGLMSIENKTTVRMLSGTLKEILASGVNAFSTEAFKEAAEKERSLRISAGSIVADGYGTIYNMNDSANSVWKTYIALNTTPYWRCHPKFPYIGGIGIIMTTKDKATASTVCLVKIEEDDNARGWSFDKWKSDVTAKDKFGIVRQYLDLPSSSSNLFISENRDKEWYRCVRDHKLDPFGTAE